MANVKNYGLRGVGSDVQMGKAGGRLVYDSGNTLFKFTESDGSTLAKIQVADPTGANDAVSKGYLDGVQQGLDIKASVRAASTGNGTLASDFANGETLDGVTLATGDRILLKDQTDASENGVYVVAASGAPARADDFDDSDSVSSGAFTFVEEGTANADAGFVVTADGAITVGTTDITFVQFSGAGQITAGAAMTKTGNTLDVAVDDSSIEVSGDALQVKAGGITNAMLAGSIDLTSKVTGTLPVANGGTGAATHTSGGVLVGAGTGAVTSTKAAPTGDFVGTSDTQTMTNKTLTSPSISGGTINGNTAITTNNVTISGGTMEGVDVTIGTGKTLDVDGAVDIDASSGNMDGVTIGANTPAAGTFTTAETTGLATLASVDINGGAIDNAVIGGTTPASITGTNVRANTKLVVETVEAFSDGNDITFSDPAVFNEGISLPAGQTLALDDIGEATAGHGVEIDGVTLKDGGIAASGTVDLTGATLTLDDDAISGDKVEGGTINAITINTMTSGTVDINGGAIDGTTIGGTTAAAGSFTTLNASGAFTSQGIDDNATSTQVTVSDTSVSLAGDLAVTGDISAANMTLSGNITISGDTVTADVSTLSVEDSIMELARGNSAGSETHIGIKAERGSAGDDAYFLWDEANDRWIAATSSDESTFTLANMAFGGLSLENVTGNLIGDVKATDGTVVLDNGSDGTDATFTGDVTGDVTGNITSTGTSTFTTVDINGGAIDGAAIGANSASTGAFTTLDASGAMTGTTGDFSGNMTAASITDESLTAGRVTFAGTGGDLSDSANFAWNNSTNTLTVTGVLAADNLQIDGNTLSSTNTNGNVTIDPNGTGVVDVSNSRIMQVSTPTQNGDAANKQYVDDELAALTVMTMSDGTNNQTITAGDTMTFAGTSNEVEVEVSATDTITIGLPNDVTIGNDLTVTGDVGGATATITGAVTGGSLTDGTATISSGAISGATTVTASGAVTGGSLTDGTMTISSGSITGADDITSTGDLSVGGNATITGNLTVNGTLTSISTTNTEIQDNVILLNDGESGAGVTGGTSGIEVDRGSSDNADFVFDESDDTWKARINGTVSGMAVGDLSANELTLANELALDQGGTHTDTSGFAADSLMKMTGSGGVSELAKGSNNTVLKVNGSGTLGYAAVDLTADVTGSLPVANGGTGLTSVGSAAQILRVNSGANGVEWAYNEQLYNSNGDLILDTSGATTSTNKIVVTNAADEVIMTAASAGGTGDIDLRLKAQGSGNVIIDGSGAGYVGGDDDEDLNVRGGASDAGAAGDLVLRGGFGASTYASGNVVIAGGTGGSASGAVKIQDSNLADVLTLDGVSSAANYATLTNSAAGDAVEFHTEGSDTDVNLLLDPKGDGVVNVPASYKDRSEFGTNSLVTKEYVDSQTDAGAVLQVFRASLGAATADLGDVANASGKSYYITKVTIHVTTAFDASADHFIISDGSNDFTVAADTDASATGTYVIEMPYETATAGGATVSVAVKDSSNNTITYNAGAAIVSCDVVAV